MKAKEEFDWDLSSLYIILSIFNIHFYEIIQMFSPNILRYTIEHVTKMMEVIQW